MKKALILILVLISGSLTAFFFSGSIANGRNDPIEIPEIPRPYLTRSYIPPSQADPSRIAVPITISMDNLQSLTNRNLIRHYNGDVEYLDGTIKGKLNYRLRREGDVKVAEEKGRIKISFPLKFNVRFVGGVLAGFVRVPFSAQTDGELNLYITVKPGIRRDWSIKTEAEADFTWIKSPKLRVAGITIGLQRETDKFLMEAIRDNLYKIDDVINKEVRLREMMQREWDNLTDPIRVTDAVTLHFDPRSVA
ncbi:MAG: DUF4403 family protein, partial [Synergistaceae bacterium]|nr:DUF4403 family protein [Synergistaceae bacterium]